MAFPSFTTERLRVRPITPNDAIRKHGHYRLKGISEPIQIFELGDSG